MSAMQPPLAVKISSLNLFILLNINIVAERGAYKVEHRVY